VAVRSIVVVVDQKERRFECWCQLIPREKRRRKRNTMRGIKHFFLFFDERNQRSR